MAPACAIAAPMNPPNKVCEELDGIPNHQVSRFQAMAPINPEKITSRLMNSAFTELAMVFPILNSPMIYFEIKKAAKLNSAAQSTA